MFQAPVEKNRIQEIELRREVGYWQAQHRRAVERESALRARNQELEALLRRQKAEITQKDREIEKLKAKNAWLQQQVFGRKTNQTTAKSCNDAEASPDSSPASSLEHPEEKRKRGQQKGAKGHGRKIRANLPAVETPHTLPEEECRCPKCGKPLRPWLLCGIENWPTPICIPLPERR